MGQTGTMVIDVKGSNNMIYLPLDKLQQNAQMPPSAGVVEEKVAPASQDNRESNQATKPARTSSARGRDSRGQP